MLNARKRLEGGLEQQDVPLVSVLASDQAGSDCTHSLAESLSLGVACTACSVREHGKNSATRSATGPRRTRDASGRARTTATAASILIVTAHGLNGAPVVMYDDFAGGSDDLRAAFGVDALRVVHHPAFDADPIEPTTTTTVSQNDL